MLRAIRFQIAKDTSSERTKFIASFLAERRALRFLLAAIRWFPIPGLEASLLLLLGMSRCIALAGSHRGKAIWWTKNEARYLQSYLAEISIEYIRYQFGLANIFRCLKILPAKKVFKIFRIAKRLRRRHSFVVAQRAVETMIFYQYVKLLLVEDQHLCFYSSTQSHPYFSALNELSRTGRVKLCFLAHSPWVLDALPIFCDLGIFWGPAGAKQFVDCGSRFQDVVFFYPVTGAKFENSPNPRNSSALISLSKNPDWPAVRRLIKDAQAIFPQGNIHVRRHPNSVFSVPSDLYAYVSQRPLLEELANCQFMIAGNSTVHLEALYSGVPSFWAPELDGEQTSPLEFFDQIPIQRFDRLLSATAQEPKSLYTAETFQRVREEYFSSTERKKLGLALLEFEKSSGRTGASSSEIVDSKALQIFP